MTLKNTKIGTQLILGFAAVLIFVSVLGSLAFIQTNEIQGNLETLYNHPLIVRRALADLRLDITQMQLNQREMLQVQNEAAFIKLSEDIALNELNIIEKIDTLEQRYLGPTSDIVAIRQDFESWKTLFDMDTQLIKLLDTETYIDHVGRSGLTTEALNTLDESVTKVDKFALEKGDDLYNAAVNHKRNLNNQLAWLIGAILGLTLLISVALIANIRKPLHLINGAVNRFHHGEKQARIIYSQNNEFKTISDSINLMMDDVEKNAELKDKVTALSSMMLLEDNTDRFFRSLLSLLMETTRSYLAAIYQLSDEQDRFDHVASIGATSTIKQSFRINDLEGESGKVILSDSVSLITDIPENTRFSYLSSTGSLVPREIMTIPLMSNQKKIGFITLATLHNYDETTLAVIDSIQMTMNARIDGILIAQKNKEYQASLEIINQELTAHKQELSSQALELLQQNSELEMQKNQLNEASKLKTSFLANMSHELRTPLNSVIALSGILSRKLKDQISDETYSYIEIIERNGKNLLDLINDILDLSRMEAGKEDIEAVSFNLNQLIEELIQMLKPQADIKKIKLNLETDGKEMIVVSDQKKCRQILQNLVGNAVKFTNQGSVTIKAAATASILSINVIDTGIGISQENLLRIFDEFRQADDTTSRRFGGTGLGLAIARKYARLLGGDVTVESSLNIGSTFTLTLKNGMIHEEKFQKPIAETKNVVGSSFSTTLAHQSILLVDDNETALIQIRDLLSDTGIHVLTASNASEAFQIIQRQIPDAMVLDLMMPEVDGFSVLEQLRNANETAHIPVLILTAKHISKDDMTMLKRNNVHQLIQKGFVEKTELHEAISGMLKLNHQRTKTILKNESDKPLVLIAEDNPDNMITLKALLNDRFTLIETTQGQDALLQSQENKPDLILMDLSLPILSGIEVMRTLRDDVNTSTIPIIALSAGVMDIDQRSLLRKGFNAFVAKPIDAKTLHETIEKVLYDK